MAKRAKKSKKEKLLDEEFSQIFSSNSFVQQAFHTLLTDTDFVSKVIDIYRRDELRKYEFLQRTGLPSSVTEIEESLQREAEFLRKYLPNWLYQAIDTLAVEALFAATGEPMLKSRASDLYNFIFVERPPGAPPLKDGRNEVWNSRTLKWAINHALPQIKVPGNVTLAALARKINGLPKVGRLKKQRKALTGKHLQSLLKEHHIDWIKIKKRYKKRLHEERDSQKSTQSAAK
jgi:hypothetical protein